MRVGAIRLKAERSIRVGSYIHSRIEEELIHILDKTGLDDLTLNESLGLYKKKDFQEERSNKTKDILSP